MVFGCLAAILCSQSERDHGLDLVKMAAALSAGRDVLPSDLGFTSDTIKTSNGTVEVYTLQVNRSVKPTKLFLHIGGTGADNMYYGGLDAATKKPDIWSTQALTDFRPVPADCLYVVVGKPGMSFWSKNPRKEVPKQFLEQNSLPARVSACKAALELARKKLRQEPESTIVWGYSEGFYVASKLASESRLITHLGVGGGGGYSDFLDFVIFIRRAANAKAISETEADNRIESVLDEYRQIMADPNNTESTDEYTNLRWSSYAEPAYVSLAKLSIPVYQAICTQDDSAPVENAMIVPLEFIRLKKKNLTVTSYPWGHGFIEEKDGTQIYHLSTALRDFFDWTSRNPK